MSTHSEAQGYRSHRPSRKTCYSFLSLPVCRLELLSALLRETSWCGQNKCGKSHLVSDENDGSSTAPPLKAQATWKGKEPESWGEGEREWLVQTSGPHCSCTVQLTALAIAGLRLGLPASCHGERHTHGTPAFPKGVYVATVAARDIFLNGVATVKCPCLCEQTLAHAPVNDPNKTESQKKKLK